MVDVAAMPEANTSAASARSSAAIFCSVTTIVGFAYREYKYFSTRPSW